MEKSIKGWQKEAGAHYKMSEMWKAAFEIAVKRLQQDICMAFGEKGVCLVCGRWYSGKCKGELFKEIYEEILEEAKKKVKEDFNAELERHGL